MKNTLLKKKDTVSRKKNIYFNSKINHVRLNSKCLKVAIIICDMIDMLANAMMVIIL